MLTANQTAQTETTTAAMTAQDAFDLYCTLRDTKMSIEDQMKSLQEKIKPALAAGEVLENDTYRGVLTPTTITEYPVAAYREALGDAAALEVATIDRKAVDALVKSGDLDGTTVAGLARTRAGTPSLRLVAVEVQPQA